MVFRYLQRLIQSFSEVDWSVWSISVRSDTAGEAGSDAWDVRDAPEVRDVRDPDVSNRTWDTRLTTGFCSMSIQDGAPQL